MANLGDAMAMNVEVEIQYAEAGTMAAVLGELPLHDICSALNMKPTRVLEPGRNYPGVAYFTVSISQLILVACRLAMFMPHVPSFNVVFKHNLNKEG
jgi:hypothetical protein